MTLVTQQRSADVAAAEPLLSYTVTTTPDPLKASPENPQEPEEMGELLIVASRRSGTPMDVQSIRVKVPAGTMSPDLATDLAKVTPKISLADWTVALDASAKEFVFTPAADHATIGPDTGFTIQLAQIPINRKVGTSPINVWERGRTGSAAFQDRATAFDVGKFPADFYLRNLICDPLVIDNGGEATLTWERSANATYELLYGDVHIPDVTNETTRTITNLKSDTTFYLRGTAGDPANPVVRILSAQVTVIKPDLNIGHLIVNGTSTFHQPCTVKSGLAIEGPVDMISRFYLGQASISWPEYETTAPSDGFLWVETFEGTVMVTASGFEEKLTGDTRTCLVPVEKDTAIQIRWMTAPHLLNAWFFSFGGVAIPKWEQAS